MKKYAAGTPERGLQDLAYKYGGACAIIIANSFAIAAMLSVIVYSVVSFMPNSDQLIDSGTDAGFALLMILNETAAYVVPLITLYVLFYRDLKFEKTISEPSDTRYNRFFGATILLFLGGQFTATCGSMLTSIVSSLLNTALGIPETKVAFSDFLPQNTFQFTVFEVSTSIVAPVCEEIIYRHILLKPLRRYGDLNAAVITALMFGLSHFNFDQFLYTFSFGFFLAVIALRTGSVIPAVICHIINNLMAGIQTYLPETFGNAEVDALFDKIADILGFTGNVMFYAGIPALVLIIAAHLLRTRNRSGIPDGRQTAIVLSNPLFLVCLILSLIITFLNLYR